MKILSLDVPGSKEGGAVLWSPSSPHSYLFTPILFNPLKSERDDYIYLASLLQTAAPTIIILEHAFLYKIAGHVGAIKLWAALNNATWWMTGPSFAKKKVLNNGRAEKKDVLEWAHRFLDYKESNIKTLTQHMADALLYLEAYRMTENP